MSVQKNTAKVPFESQRLQWDDIRYFLELARVGSLSGAARNLSVEHSTVARRVEALEQTLEVKLFDRLPKGWSLTLEGETLAQQASRLDDEAQAFSRAAVGVSSLNGTVRVSAPPVLASHLLVPRLAGIRSQWMNIDLEVIGESRDANLSRGEADLAIRMSRPTARGLVARRIGEMGYGLYAANGYADRPRPEWEFLGYDENLSQVAQQRWLNQIAGDRRFVFRSNDLAALLHAARAGLGIAALPRFLAAHDPALRLLPDHPCSTVRQLWLVMHPDVKRSPRVRLVADLLVKLVGTTPELSLREI
ncbi:LysR family transcriptional regulator [Paraburkholderia sp. MMS20-SJTR3]|uniref:LysR family transcriptional regulator n=1 Tax=Paraburkholderia sejongensis TaxID=2886946 RepID=A0ABS8JVB1_9BURK|nr:LysR family transcriptional regulator [Paraburkholderia sp. MMS20-SJTR3]MCC8393827.1 LysR family transcriptional regulator [Paraburkholderia sp. MMS20-SJTR3]